MRNIFNSQKIYKKYFADQMNEYLSNMFPKYHCSFQEGHRVQDCQVPIIKKSKKIQDAKAIFAVFPDDLSKTLGFI